MKFFEKNYKDLIALVILIYCLSALIFKTNIEANLFQTLGYIITGSLGFLFGSHVK